MVFDIEKIMALYIYKSYYNALINQTAIRF